MISNINIIEKTFIIKKAIGIFVLLAMLFNAVHISAAAAPIISAGSASGEKGDVVTIKVEANNFEDAALIQFLIEYDLDIFDELTKDDITMGSQFSSGWYIDQNFKKPGIVALTLLNNDGLTINSPIKICDVKFKINSNAAEGEYPIKIVNPTGNLINAKGSSVIEVESENGAIKVIKEDSGSGGGGNGRPGGGGGGRSGGGTGGIVVPGTGSEQPTEQEEKQEPEEKELISFKDVTEDHWAKTYIEAMAAEGIIAGKGDGIFDPDGKVTRAEFAKLITAVMGIVDEEATVEFSDIKGDEWYVSYVAAAYKAGIITGRPDGTFAPNETITRQDMAVMIARAINAEKPENIDEIINFADKDEIADYAKEAIAIAVKANIITGKPENKMDPTGTTTRAEAATVIYKLFNM